MSQVFVITINCIGDSTKQNHIYSITRGLFPGAMYEKQQFQICNSVANPLRRREC